ncbi:MAG: mannose-1-phosphate guanylyltransferase [Alistipes sp.]|nr:mannose-1-phosphate guanylyltransferase [Alistipes sp.]
MNNNTFCVIMAGGVGSRFWPMSRRNMPKQFLDILGTGKSFIRSTYERFLPLVPKENFLVVTNRAYRSLVMEHIPELDPEQILCEPIGRNTAPAIAYAAHRLRKKCADARMIVTPSDHLILNEAEFQVAINECLEFVADHDALMTVGIEPSRPDTGYGYLQKSDSNVISRVKCFTEKPALEIAQAFVDCGEFVWNSGLFVWSIDSIMRAFETYLPEHHALFTSAYDALATESEEQVIEQVFAECKSISIDYGVMEKAENVYVRCSDFGWSDVGTWGSVYQLSQKDRNENMLSHDGCYAYDTSKSIVSVREGKVAVIKGLNDYIVVDTDDVLLVCPRSDEQSIKKYIDDVRFDKGEKYV